ncbi:MAG: IS91 family transposase, partial [Gemmatimonadales bacterium]|nr:IS91 family transposase [Gemmatimonadales bacterium]
MGASAAAAKSRAPGDAPGSLGVYRPRRPRASPLYRLLEDHFAEFSTVYDERFAHRYGYWRPVVAEVVEKFLACGILKHGFARVRCGGCAHEYLLAFSCKCRYFCPTCHAKRLALWGLWLEETLLAPVPHRQVVLTVPKRLRPYFFYERALLGDLSRVAARTITGFIRATVGEADLSVGLVASIQTHGSLANWQPHLHVLVTDGGFRADGTFVRWPLHDVATLSEAFRRAVLRLFVRRGLMNAETARGMLAWPHSGFHVHDGVWVAAADREFAVRLARYCARNPVALRRLEYQSDNATVTYHSDKPTGPTAGSEKVDALEFLARVVSHIPDKGQVLQRYYGWYANRTRGTRRKAGGEEQVPVYAEPVPVALRQTRRRWAELLRRIFEIDPL